MADAPAPVRPRHLLDLPIELLVAIAGAMPLSAVKQWRLTCRELAARLSLALRIYRVFLSANWTNIRVLHEMAGNDAIRQGVTEIVWDDARLVRGRASPGTGNAYYSGSTDPIPPDAEYPQWFEDERADNEREVKARLARFKDRPDHIELAEQLQDQIPAEHAWKHYSRLMQHEDEVLSSGADVDAFRHALLRFPNVKRLTITPAAHGFTFLPLYQTPMIRELPYGFNYPIPRGWPTAKVFDTNPELQRWDRADETYKDQWRGFRLALRVLAEPGTQHAVTELDMNVHGLNTGLNCHMFNDEKCQEYADFVALLSRPGFRHLHLPLLAGELDHYSQANFDWPSLREGGLRRALAHATDLEHFSLSTGGRQEIATWYSGSMDVYVPLRSVVPIGSWPRLRHISLSRFYVTIPDLVGFLEDLPAGVRFVEMSFLLFLQGGRYRDLAFAMRDRLDWRRRPVGERPRLLIKLNERPARAGKALWVDREVEDFVYGDRGRLFGGEDGAGHDQIPQGTGGTTFDEFNPGHVVPNDAEM